MEMANNVEPLKPSLMSGGSIKAIVPQSFEDCYRLAKVVAASGLAPQGLNSEAKITIAIMHGMEVGMPPMQAIQRIAVINGRPSIWGDAAIGLVRASGLCEYIKEWVEGEGNAAVAYCETKRRGEAEPIRSSFSVDDAV